MNDVPPIIGHLAEAFGAELASRAVASETLASGGRLLTTFVVPAEGDGLEASALWGRGQDGADSAHLLIAVDLGLVVPPKRRAAARHFARLFGLLQQPFGLVVDDEEARLTYAAILYSGAEAVWPAVITALAANVSACRAGLHRIIEDDLSEEEAEAAVFTLWPIVSKEVGDA